MTSEAATVVSSFLKAFAAGDIPGALEWFHAETVVDEARGLPFSGTYTGPDEFVGLLGVMTAALEMKVEKVEVLDAGTAAVARIDLTFISKATGRELLTSVAEVYRVSDGKITHADLFYKDPGAVADLING